MMSSAYVLLGILITTDAKPQSLPGLNKPTLTMDGPGYVSSNLISDSSLNIRDSVIQDDEKPDGIHISVPLEDSSSNGISRNIGGLQQDSAVVTGFTEDKLMEHVMHEPETLNMNVNAVPLDDSPSNSISGNIGGLQQDSAVVPGFIEGNIMEHVMHEPETLNKNVNAVPLDDSPSNGISGNIGGLQQVSAVVPGFIKDNFMEHAMDEPETLLNMNVNSVPLEGSPSNGINGNIGGLQEDSAVDITLNNQGFDNLAVDDIQNAVGSESLVLETSAVKDDFSDRSPKMHNQNVLDGKISSNVDRSEMLAEEPAFNHLDYTNTDIDKHSISVEFVESPAVQGFTEGDSMEREPKMNEPETLNMDVNSDKSELPLPAIPITNKLDLYNDAGTRMPSHHTQDNSQSTSLNNGGTVIELNDAWGFLFQNTFAGPLAHKYFSNSQTTSNYSQAGQTNAAPPNTYRNIIPVRDERQMSNNSGAPVMLNKGVTEANNQRILIVFNRPKHFTFQNTFTGTVDAETQL